MREGLLAASTAVGLEVMAELIDAEVADLAGPEGRHDTDRTAVRHGTEAGSVTLGGRRVPVRRPRVRTVAAGDQPAREVTLESYATLAATDLLRPPAARRRRVAARRARRHVDGQPARRGRHPAAHVGVDQVGRGQNALPNLIGRFSCPRPPNRTCTFPRIRLST